MAAINIRRVNVARNVAGRLFLRAAGYAVGAVKQAGSASSVQARSSDASPTSFRRPFAPESVRGRGRLPPALGLFGLREILFRDEGLARGRRRALGCGVGRTSAIKRPAKTRARTLAATSLVSGVTGRRTNESTPSCNRVGVCLGVGGWSCLAVWAGERWPRRYARLFLDAWVGR